MYHRTKSRVIPVNLGTVRPDGKYYTGSGSYNGSAENRQKLYIDPLIDIHMSYSRKADLALGYPANMGAESISYFNSRDEKEVYKPCVHRKRGGVFLPYTSFTKAYNTSQYYIVWFFRQTASDRTYPPIDVIQSHLSLNNLEAARIRAWKVMYPRFESEFSLLNFLWELSDVKRLAYDLGVLFTRLYASKRTIRRKLAGIKKAKLDPTEPISNLVLQWNLAIAPLISDIQNIYGILQTKFQDAINQFVAFGNDLYTRHYSELLFQNASLVKAAKNDYFKMTGYDHKTIMTHTMDYTYSFIKAASVKNYLNYVGLTGDWEKIWNGIPFSFVVDYFVKIGEAIHFMKRTDPDLSLSLYSYGESLKSTKDHGIYVQSSNNAHIVVDGSRVDGIQQIAGQASKLYTRMGIAPRKIGIYTPRVKSPSDKQALNIICLIRSSIS